MLCSVLSSCADPMRGTLPEQGELATGLVLLVHGSGDTPADWSEELGAVMRAAMEQPELWDVVAYDWSKDAERKLSAARRGLAHGEAIGARLTDERSYSAVQIISHSVGGHVGYGIEETWTEGVLQHTYLDPFGGRGMVRWGYGYRRFGENASFAEAYFNADDGVPSTERSPRHTHGFDVTALRSEADADDAHWWPIQWYQDSLGSGLGLDLALPLGGDVDWANHPVGEQTVLTP